MEERELRREIAHRVRELRRSKGLTQRELARALGVFPNAISRLELGRFSPRLQTLINIAALLDVELVVQFGKDKAQ